jgi:predicted ATP-binding protein involved in virulence
MKIRTLRLENYRRFRDFSIDFNSGVTVLVARNGAGKTSILDAIATALGTFLTRLPGIKGISPRETDALVEPDLTKVPYMRISCESTDGIKWDRTERRDKTQRTQSSIPPAEGIKALNAYADKFIDAETSHMPYTLPVFLYYGTGRGVYDSPQRKRGFRKNFRRFDAFEGGLESRANFRRFVEYFFALEDVENRLQKEKKDFDTELPELKVIREAIHRMMPEFSNPRTVFPVGIMLDWADSGTAKQLLLEQLSDGYRMTLVMTMDIAARMAEANPHMEDALATEGIVLIDEIDLHLHPGWQQHILPDLARTFPNIQFIVSTHSPQIIGTVAPDSIRVIDWKGETPTLVPVDFSRGAESQQILMQILGVEARAPELEEVKDLERYQALVSKGQWDTEEAWLLRSRLDTWSAGNEPELNRLDIDIRLQELDRKK